MEMASGCQAARPAGRPVRGPHGGWQKQEIDALQRSIDEAARSGESLRSVFERMSRELGRKPNSIRNFYYAQVRAQEGGTGRALPFETFSQEEVERLIEQVLTARARGMSVRACVRELSGGDRTRMLRYQNKYRSTIRARPELVRRVMDRLSAQGTPFISPYAADEADGHAALDTLRTRAAQSDDPQLGQLFDALDHLLTLALERPAPDTPDSDAQRRADRLSARCDMLRIALDDEQHRALELRAQAGEMVTLVKEYIALPEADRTSRCADFCQQAAARLSAVECALMAPEESG
ncbi:MAG: hypothetical protein ACI4PG_11960 [Candidatus Ventricola sp.]